MSQYNFSTTGTTIVSDFPLSVKNRTFIITGPSTGGIGAQTAISLAHGSPAKIILIGRDITKIQPTIDTIHSINPSISTPFFKTDLSSLSSVRSVAKEILADKTIAKIDILINNAAIMASPYELSVDGYELQFATNYLSHFLLTNLLMPKLLAAGPEARIVNVSSVGHLFCGINWSSTSYNEGKDYWAWEAYAQAKTANILFTVSLNEKLASAGGEVRSFALHPGRIESKLMRYVTPEAMMPVMERWNEKGLELEDRKTLDQGCSTTLRAALDTGLEAVDGCCYLADCQIVRDPKYVASYALDKEDAERLWTMSEEMVGEKFAY